MLLLHKLTLRSPMGIYFLGNETPIPFHSHSQLYHQFPFLWDSQWDGNPIPMIISNMNIAYVSMTAVWLWWSPVWWCHTPYGIWSIKYSICHMDGHPRPNIAVDIDIVAIAT